MKKYKKKSTEERKKIVHIWKETKEGRNINTKEELEVMMGIIP